MIFLAGVVGTKIEAGGFHNSRRQMINYRDVFSLSHSIRRAPSEIWCVDDLNGDSRAHG